MEKSDFNEFKLSKEILKSLELLNYNEPTKVQKRFIPIILKKNDVIIQSHTGSGKTATFAIPVCQFVDWKENKPQALIITPTRELALQVKEDVFNIGRFKRLKVCALYGKSPFYIQAKELKQKTHIVVGTPGRINDHLSRNTLDFSNIKYLIIDEADEMMKMGFIKQIQSIISELPTNRLTIVLSATIPKEIKDLCCKYMKNPIHIALENELTKEVIIQEQYKVDTNKKTEVLINLLKVENPDSCMIFCNTQKKVEELFKEFTNKGYEKNKLSFSRNKSLDIKDSHTNKTQYYFFGHPCNNYLCERIHGGMEQIDRFKIMNNYKKSKFRYLIATDVAARGIDIDNISLVINYDVPNKVENYVHRIGRTGRIGNKGKAITLVSDFEEKLMYDIQMYLNKNISINKKPNIEKVLSSKEDFIKKINLPTKVKEEKSMKVNKNIIKLHINAGKKTKMRAVDIVGTLCNLDDVEASDIGIINIMDISTYVEILNNKGESVLTQLQTKTIKGRLRKVNRTER
ncbi:MAG: DEAD/DEAH box helicase [Clostridiales bacterium]